MSHPGINTHVSKRIPFVICKLTWLGLTGVISRWLQRFQFKLDLLDWQPTNLVSLPWQLTCICRRGLIESCNSQGFNANGIQQTGLKSEFSYLITLSEAIVWVGSITDKNKCFKLSNIKYWKSSHTLRQKRFMHKNREDTPELMTSHSK